MTLVRLAINGLFLAGGVDDAQVVVGAAPDGIWGPASQAALTSTIAELQRAWNLADDDGIWGPATESSWALHRAAFFRP